MTLRISFGFFIRQLIIVISCLLFLPSAATNFRPLHHLRDVSRQSKDKGFCKDSVSSTLSEMESRNLGGVHESQSNAFSGTEIEGLGRFAVQEHNKKQHALLEFARVVKAEEQVVSGTLHHLIVEAIDAGNKKLYEAKVWMKPWMNFKELQEFKQHDANTPLSFTPSDLGAKTDGHPKGWQDVPVHDPEVQNAADHAITSIQQKSNSLFPYELQEITKAKAEVMEDVAKFNLHLRVKRGNKEEHFNVEVHKKSDGNFLLNQMDAYAP